MRLCFHQVSHKARCLKIHMTIKTLNSANKPTHSRIFKERITFIFKPSLTCGRCKLSIACCAENGNHWTHFLSELFFHFANTTSSSLRNSINKQKERITTHLPKISSLTQAIKKKLHQLFMKSILHGGEETQGEISHASELLCNWISLHFQWSAT